MRTRLLSIYVYKGILNKGLDSLQLLLMGSSSLKNASEVMDSSVVSIPYQCSRWYLVQTLAATSQQIFPVVGYKDTSGVEGDNQESEHKIEENSKSETNLS